MKCFTSTILLSFIGWSRLSLMLIAARLLFVKYLAARYFCCIRLKCFSWKLTKWLQFKIWWAYYNCINQKHILQDLIIWPPSTCIGILLHPTWLSIILQVWKYLRYEIMSYIMWIFFYWWMACLCFFINMKGHESTKGETNTDKMRFPPTKIPREFIDHPQLSPVHEVSDPDLLRNV